MPGDQEWIADRDNTFDLDLSVDYPGPRHAGAGRRLYNIIDWTGQTRGQIALTREEFQAINPIRRIANAE